MRREVNLDGNEYVRIGVSSGGVTFDPAEIVVRVNRGAWLPTDVLDPEVDGKAVVGFLCAPAALGLLRHREYVIEARHVDSPETIIMKAGTLVVT